ncbi:hypothetical protein TRVL_06447 [Trypanosoma vivax]|nr:hypothetical protein TRVL_06447 [Trypanosoma vivax]
MQADSDEEAAVACSASILQTAPQNVASVISNSSITRFTQLSHELNKLLEFEATVPDVITFRVDGKLFSVHRSTLLKDPQSVLFVMVERHFRSRNAGDIVDIPGKDANLFGMLLKVLRGYKNPVPEVYREACETEALFYGLTRSWGLQYPLASMGPFRPLSLGDRLFSDVVCATASPYYATGIHCITFQIERCENMALGVMACGTRLPEAESVRYCEGLALYWSDGHLTRNFGVHTTEVTGCTFRVGKKVRVELNCRERMVKWFLSHEKYVSVTHIPPNTSFAFVALMVKSSEVKIVKS